MNEELNFSQLLKVVKKSLKRALIYVLASAILVVAVLFTVRSFQNYTVSTSIVSVTEESGVTYELINRNKAIAVQKALKSYNPQPDDVNFEKDVLNALAITAETPASENSDAETVFVPLNFTLSLNGDNLSALNDKELNSLLAEITEELLVSLSVSNLPKLEVSTNLENSLLVMEYFQITEDLYNQSQKIYKTINAQLAENQNLFAYANSTTGYTLGNVLSSIETLCLKLNSLKTDIIVNRIENTGKLEDVLTLKIANCQFNVNAYQTMATAALETLKSFPKGVDSSSSSSTTVVINTEAYKALAEEYNSLLRLQADAKYELDKYESYLATLPATANPATVETYKTHVVTSLTDILADLKGALDDYRDIVNDYNSNYFSSNVEIIKPAYTTTANAFSISTIIRITVVVALVAYLVAFIQAFASVKKETSIQDQPAKENE